MSAFDPIDTAPEAGTIGAPERAEFIGRAASHERVTIAFVTLIAVAALLLLRGADVQLIHGRAFATAAARNRTRTEIIVPTRGIVEDRNGVPLVRNVPRYAIGVVPADLPTGAAAREAIAAISDIVSIAPETVQEALQRYPRHLTEAVPLRDGLAYEEAARLFVAARGFPSVRLLVENARDYGDDHGRDLESMSHVLGYMGRVSAEEYVARAAQRYRAGDTVGKTGIEGAYEAALRGTPGLRTVTVDARGRTVATSAVEPAVAGATVRITIDRTIQERAERALRAGARAVGARRGSVVALDPTTGEVLALVSVPAFSNTALTRGLSTDEYRTLAEDPDHPLFPRAIAGTYPSGSTIKPMVAAAALSAGVITPRTRIVSSGGIRVGASFFPDWRAGGHGAVTVTEALAQSVNTFFYIIGGGHPNFKFQISNFKSVDGTRMAPLGADGIAAAFRAFGFSQPTGIDIAGEAAGLVPTPAWKQEARDEDWYIGDTYHLAIGQGDLLVTPLQLAVATAAIANGGYKVQPHLVRARGSTPGVEEERSDGKTPGVEERARERERIPDITNEAIRVVRQGMRLAVTNGSAARLADLPFEVAGKTGTAQTTANRRPHAWFTGFAERQQGSRAAGQQGIVVTVLIEEGGEGSAVAVPIAREVLLAWAQ